MMIVISTGRSPTEKMLHRYAAKFFSGLPRDGKSLHLKSPASVSKNLLQELQRRAGVSLFFFGHGLNPPATGFLGDDGKPAIEAKTIRYLARRKVVATCCHGDRVGAMARRNRFHVFGYTGTYWVWLKPRHLAELQAAALAGPMVIAAGGTTEEAAAAARGEYLRLAAALDASSNASDQAIASYFSANANRAGAW
jgi:hypothetical protein